MTVKIVLPKPGEPVRAGAGTRCILPCGEELQGVAAIDIRIRPEEVITATAELCAIATDDIEAGLKVVMMHPVTSELVHVKSITFADGTTWSAE